MWRGSPKTVSRRDEGEGEGEREGRGDCEGEENRTWSDFSAFGLPFFAVTEAGPSEIKLRRGGVDG